MEIYSTISLVVSLFTLGVLVFSNYRQYFYKKKRVYFILLGISQDIKFRFGIANGGNLNVFLCSISISIKEIKQGQYVKSQILGPLYVKKDTLILPANEIHEFSIDIPNQIPKGLSPKIISDGIRKYNALDLTLSVHLAFPDGKRYLAEVDFGDIRIQQDEMGSGYAINQDFVDLMKISKRQ